MPPTVKSELRRAIYDMVGRIPYGKVATYGQIAHLAGYPGRARQVGYALAGMPEEMDLPWHRVINAQGKISPRAIANPIVCSTCCSRKRGLFSRGPA